MNFDSGNRFDDLSSETERTDYFDADLMLFRDLNDRHIAQMLKTSSETDGYDLVSNVHLAPFYHHNLVYMLLRNQGVRLGFSEETLFDRPNMLGLKVHPQDKAIYHQTMDDYRTVPTDFIRQVTNGEIDVLSLDPQHHRHQEIRNEIIDTFSFTGEHDLSTEEIDELLKRAFLTSRLISRLKEMHLYELLNEGERAEYQQIHNTPDDASRKRQNSAQYEAFRRQGYLALGSEELFGIVNGFVQDIFEWNPEIAKEMKRRQEKLE